MDTLGQSLQPSPMPRSLHLFTVNVSAEKEWRNWYNHPRTVSGSSNLVQLEKESEFQCNFHYDVFIYFKRLNLQGLPWRQAIDPSGSRL